MCNIPKTSQAVGSFEERWESGVWIGTTIRDGMSLIGTAGWVYKVGAIKRKPDGEQWSRDMVKNIAVIPSNHNPGSARGGSPRLPRISSKSRQLDFRSSFNLLATLFRLLGT